VRNVKLADSCSFIINGAVTDVKKNLVD